LRVVLDKAPGVRWIQLPWAGIDAFAAAGLIQDGRTWTCAKGCYADPVAEHALGLAIAGLRHFPERMAANSWGVAKGASLYDARVTILGGGGIAQSLLGLLKPFRVDATVVRRHGGAPVDGANRTVGPDQIDEVLADRLIVFVALSFTQETRGIIDRSRLQKMDANAWLVNVARGAHVVTADLVDALQANTIAGAALDVTDPEPLPDGHPLWDLPNAIITPHTADWPEVCDQLLAALEGLVDPTLGY
jgi:phosphoglycerate dehydrogenase-like enzyme